MHTSTDMEPNRVRVEGWSLPRRISVAKDTVALEVVKGTCRCDTCFGRLHDVQQCLLRKGIRPITFEVAGSVAIVVPMSEGDDPCRAVSEAIGRQVEAF